MRCSDIQTQPTNQHALCGSHNGASQWGSNGRWEICESKCPAPHPCLTNFHSHTFHSLLSLHPFLRVDLSVVEGSQKRPSGHSPLPKHSCMNHLIVGWVQFLTLLCPLCFSGLYFDNHTQLQCEEVFFFVATVGHKLKGWFTVRLDNILKCLVETLWINFDPLCLL